MSCRILILAFLCCDACGGRDAARESSTVRAAIATEITRGVEATRTKDIDTYLDQLPRDWKLYDESGTVISRQQLRENALRDWSIIAETRAIDVVIDSLTSYGDSAVVFTSQRWDRLMYQRDGKTLDTVITTQQHREVWRPTRRGWRASRVQELGGTVEINGRPYSP